MSEYYTEFLPRMSEWIVNLSQGRWRAPRHERKPLPAWEVQTGEYVALTGAGIVDVDRGGLFPEDGLLLKDGRIERRFYAAELPELRRNTPIAREVDCAGAYLMPGLSDLHSHPGSVIEKISMKELPYFPAQRERNCEVAIENGTTFLRVVGGNWGPISYLRREIDAGRLVGPDWLTSFVPLIPKRGIWDFGWGMNAMGNAFLFGGRYANFVRSPAQLRRVLDETVRRGAELIKTYQEERPLYGFTENHLYRMWTREELQMIREKASRHHLPLACHAMFIRGARMAIEAGVDTLEHMTVDAPYSAEDAARMAEKGVAILPTLGVGLFLAIEMGSRGYADDPDLLYFKRFRRVHVPGYIERSTIPALRSCYKGFLGDIDQGFPGDRMPGVGPIWPNHVTGFAHFARESFENFRRAGVRVGIGTDGGLGTSFSGLVEPELLLSHYLGYSIAEVLRMATLGNMEIAGLERERGSLDPGKVADVLVVAKNPLDDLKNLREPKWVFKRGRPLVRAKAEAQA